MIYSLKVELIRAPTDFDECIRVIEIPEEMTLNDLHLAILAAMRFDADHLYEFYAGRNQRHRAITFKEGGGWSEDFEIRFADEQPTAEEQPTSDEVEVADEAEAREEAEEDEDDEEEGYLSIPLQSIWPLDRYKLFYHYDFGDDWIFQITRLRKIKPVNPRAKYPRVAQSKGRAPKQYGNDW